ncbi:mannose-1-phosphate guanylyltransferase [Clostridium chauvoei]|uniref:mannose-1-phosphate guanylyltransferase n=2 Tax=Clostridium chauvoei TaxID=46867 RepID=S6EXA5_9CLOT|nr:mannose-1-phosphate guanylyltransferase [Clostridium chauvoei]ATD56174.1 mannose-1-phosphate guanylyltransferase [Clostridium chauvoei]ATD58727.1 mannose-1-phosphate guanylyltransferase [Clostridium chauvoei]MBX7279859.1 mannose-1-phosphate guanylyltransferase [Clostridium chauvoei]MBX7282223.1 mannose-1-phosphate guanylyltransferase [Clostridium chauvoei]MBX7284749.1 mannose-1-phosphate guanylyltransferase [Clostridium chauvoei]
MLCAVIMAGGKGTRFWPLSTEEKPKQFLNLIEEETMIQMTVNRILPIIPMERVFVCTGAMYVDLVREQLPNLPERNIIVEPEGRNTAPCIALSSLVIKRYYKDANMVVLPSDHLIRDEEKFRDIVKAADSYLNENKNAIVTLGMKPDRPETGYGYINYGTEEVEVNEHKVIKVNSFVEKPNLEKAKEYLKQGSYLWNGGMFLWNIENILKEIKAYLPNTYEALKEIENIKEEDLQEYIVDNYKKTDSTSIDYGILEKSNEIYVVPSEIGWDDVGSWEAIERYRERDTMGNIHVGNISSVGGKDNLVIAPNQNIIIDGLSGIYVIENDGQIIVGSKEKVSQIKELRYAR